MRIKTQDYNDVTVMELQGELTVDFVEMFRDACSSVVARNKSGIVLDMSKVSFIDSVALEQLLWLRDFCRENGSQLKLAGTDENCVKILEITRLQDKFDRHAELAEAVKSFA